MHDILERRELRVPNLTRFVRDITNDIHQTSNYIGPAILKAETVRGLDWKLVKKSRGIPVMANIHAMNAESGIGQRTGSVTFQEGEIPSIKRKIDVDPKTAVRLATCEYQSDEWKALIEEIYDDVRTLTEAVLARLEWLRWQALAKGSFSYSEDDVIHNVDFQMPAANIIDIATDGDYGVEWDNTSGEGAADWVNDLLVFSRWYKQTYGRAITRAVCSSTVMSWMLQNTSVGEKYLWGSSFSERLMAITELNALMTKYRLPKFVEYDVKVQAEDPTTGTLTEERLLPEYRVVLLPAMDPGITVFAPTHEALINSEQLVGQPAPGLYAEAWIEGKDVKTLWHKVATNAFPVMDNIDKVGVLTVKSES